MCIRDRDTAANIQSAQVIERAVEAMETPPTPEPVSYTHLDVYKRQVVMHVPNLNPHALEVVSQILCHLLGQGRD